MSLPSLVPDWTRTYCRLRNRIARVGLDPDDEYDQRALALAACTVGRELLYEKGSPLRKRFGSYSLGISDAFADRLYAVGWWCATAASLGPEDWAQGRDDAYAIALLTHPNEAEALSTAWGRMTRYHRIGPTQTEDRRFLALEDDQAITQELATWAAAPLGHKLAVRFADIFVRSMTRVLLLSIAAKDDPPDIMLAPPGLTGDEDLDASILALVELGPAGGALATLFYLDGVEASEVEQFRVDDVEMADEVVTIRRRTVQVPGAGGNLRLHPVTSRHIEEHLDGRQTGALLLASWGDPLPAGLMNSAILIAAGSPSITTTGGSFHI